MKKIVASLVFFALIVSLAFSLCACGDDYKEYNEVGLKFRLPKDFQKISVPYADLEYTSGEADFLVQIMPKTEFEDEEMGYYIRFDMTVEEYAQFFINVNGWKCEYTYDEARNVATFDCLWGPEEDPSVEPQYHFAAVLKSEEAFYIVVMVCSEELQSKYSESFREWSSYLELA